MINIQILPNINLRFEYFCSYNSSDIQRESFVTFKSANIIISYVANELDYLNQNYGFFCRTGVELKEHSKIFLILYNFVYIRKYHFSANTWVSSETAMGSFAEEIPSGYAPLAGLPLQYGLYASIVPGFTYCLLGTTRWIFSKRICAKLFSFAGKQPSVPLLSTRSCRSTTPAALLTRSIHKKKNCQ